MSLDYESQIQKYEDIIRKNELDFEQQNQEITHARRAVLGLEQQLQHFNKDFRRHKEENILLKQDKRSHQSKAKKMEKLLYGSKRTPKASGAQRVTLTKPAPTPVARQSRPGGTPGILRKMQRTQSFSGPNAGATHSLTRGPSHSSMKHYKRI